MCDDHTSNKSHSEFTMRAVVNTIIYSLFPSYLPERSVVAGEWNRHRHLCDKIQLILLAVSFTLFLCRKINNFRGLSNVYCVNVITK